MKICRQCNSIREITEFHKDKRNSDGRSLRCRICAIERSSKWYAANKGIDYKRKGRARHLTKYWPELTPEEALLKFSFLEQAQNYKCKICNKIESSVDPRTKELRRLCVDHCHKTGKVRGLLCNRCNRAVGQLEDSHDIINNVLTYLKGA